MKLGKNNSEIKDLSDVLEILDSYSPSELPCRQPIGDNKENSVSLGNYQRLRKTLLDYDSEMRSDENNLTLFKLSLENTIRSLINDLERSIDEKDTVKSADIIRAISMTKWVREDMINLS